MYRLRASIALAALLLAACNGHEQAGEGPATGPAATKPSSAVQLVGPEWKIEDIGGQGVIDNSPAYLQFLPDGRLAGNATCNRLMGRYTIKGEALSFDEGLATTMMACPEAVMNQEQRLLKLLPGINSFRIDGTGALVMQTGTGETITVHPQENVDAPVNP